MCLPPRIQHVHSVRRPARLGTAPVVSHFRPISIHVFDNVTSWFYIGFLVDLHSLACSGVGY
jgi:hypothetical protein